METGKWTVIAIIVKPIKECTYICTLHNVFARSLSIGDQYVPRPNRELFKQSCLDNTPLLSNSLPGA